MTQIEQYRIFELSVPAGAHAVFEHGGRSVRIGSFDDGERHIVRFMPDETGDWRYAVEGGEVGSFLCTQAAPGNHGPVTARGMGFVYADGTPYQPFGTTCYAWTHQPENVRERTLETLTGAPFNKIRMCVFPKHMIYSENEPQRFPFAKAEDGGWDTGAPDIAFWRDLENRIARLDALGIEADLILFHAYDRWGFAALTREQSLQYLDYCVRRLGAYKNVWWSIANEYDMVGGKDWDDWDAFGERLSREDARGHLCSIHNCCVPYPKRDWMTHVSYQSSEPRNVLALRQKYGLPVIADEFGYEGDIEFSWGNLTGREFVHRMWTAVCSGGWATHGETILNDDEHLWWAKGGALCGEAISRIAFLRGLMQKLPGTPEPLIQPLAMDINGAAMEASPFMRAIGRMGEAERTAYILEITPVAVAGEGWRLHYMGRGQSRRAEFDLPQDSRWTAQVIDTWNMTVNEASRGLSGHVRIETGGEGMAVLLTKEEA